MDFLDFGATKPRTPQGQRPAMTCNALAYDSPAGHSPGCALGSHMGCRARRLLGGSGCTALLFQEDLWGTG